MKIAKILCLGLLFFTIACKSNDTGSQDVSVTSEQSKVVSKYLGSGELTFTANVSKDHMLCMQNPAPNVANPRQEKKYVVLDLSNNSVVYHGRIESGEVKWYDAENLEIYISPGTMPKEMTRDDFTVIYNVKTKEERDKKDLNN